MHSVYLAQEFETMVISTESRLCQLKKYIFISALSETFQVVNMSVGNVTEWKFRCLFVVFRLQY